MDDVTHEMRRDVTPEMTKGLDRDVAYDITVSVWDAVTLVIGREQRDERSAPSGWLLTRLAVSGWHSVPSWVWAQLEPASGDAREGAPNDSNNRESQAEAMRQMPKKTTSRSRAPAHVKKLLAQTYARILTPEGDENYSAEILEFPGCSAQGSTPAEAYVNLERAAEAWLADWLAQGKEAPRPFMNTATSGRFALRLPTGLYVRASQAAARERVSLNQYIANAVAERVGASNTLSVLEGGASKLRPTGTGQHARM